MSCATWAALAQALVFTSPASCSVYCCLSIIPSVFPLLSLCMWLSLYVSVSVSVKLHISVSSPSILLCLCLIMNHTHPFFFSWSPPPFLIIFSPFLSLNNLSCLIISTIRCLAGCASNIQSLIQELLVTLKIPAQLIEDGWYFYTGLFHCKW